MAFKQLAKFYWYGHPCISHWSRDKMAAILQTTFSNAFSWMKVFGFRLIFHWNLFPRVQLVQIMAWRHPVDKPLSEPMMVNLLTHICVTRPQWDIEILSPFSRTKTKIFNMKLYYWMFWLSNIHELGKNKTKLQSIFPIIISSDRVVVCNVHV